MAGTFGGALEARQIRACNDLLVTRVTGEVELEEKVLVIRRIHVRFELKVSPGQRETAQRVHGLFADSCPLYRTLKHAIAITSELVMVEPDPDVGSGAA
jgi:uncharacterized OsmC-like protein